MTLKELRERRGKLLVEGRAILDLAEKENRSLTSEESAKWDKIHADCRELEKQIDMRVRQAEAEAAARAQNVPGAQDSDDDAANPAEAREEAYHDAVNAFLRRGHNGMTAEQRETLNSGPTLDPEQLRAITVADVGIVGPREFSTTVFEAMTSWTGVLQAGATVFNTATGVDYPVPTEDDTSNTGQFVEEAADDSTEANPTLSNKVLKAPMCDSKWIKVSLEMLRDSALDIESTILRIAGRRHGKIFNTKSTSGTGTNEPRGFLVDSTAGKVAAATNAITYEELLDLQHSVNVGYRMGGACRWMFADTTLTAIRKLKDGNAQYIFQPGTAGQPDRIMGSPFTINDAMPALNAGVSSKVVAYGDFSYVATRFASRPYIVRASELFIGRRLIGFRVFQGMDSVLTQPAAVKHLALAAA